jgi:hypothetical protein
VLLEISLPILEQAVIEFILSFSVLGVEQVKIGSETLMEPAVTPAFGGDQIPKPLMR